MRLTRQEVGRRGEEYAQRLLEANGYRIVDANVRFGRQGEIDIVAWDGNALCFVEVKTRTIAAAGEVAPAEAVTAAKQRQITRLALRYALACGMEGEDDGPPLRFDVVAVEMTPSGDVHSAQICRGAFWATADDLCEN